MQNSWWLDISQLDEDQQSIMSLPLNGKYLVEGPPGSGKTNLLALRAKYLKTAKRTNFAIIIYTRSLRQFIKYGMTNYDSYDYDIFHYNQWAFRFLSQIGIDYPDDDMSYDDKRAAITVTIKELIENGKINCHFYDSLLIDEAQDYSQDELEIFSSVSDNVFFVADIKQRIFTGSCDYRDVIGNYVEQTHTLRYHYRNGRKICKLADGIAKYANAAELLPTSNYDEEKNPSDVESIKCLSLHDAVVKCIQSIESQLVAYPNEHIGVIFPTNRIMQSFIEINSQQKQPANIIFHTKDNAIEFSDACNTYGMVIHNAKGLEFRAVHMFGWDEKEMNYKFNRNLTYTAITRAKTRLSIYYTEKLHGYLQAAINSLTPTAPISDLTVLFRSPDA